MYTDTQIRMHSKVEIVKIYSPKMFPYYLSFIPSTAKSNSYILSKVLYYRKERIKQENKHSSKQEKNTKKEGRKERKKKVREKRNFNMTSKPPYAAVYTQKT
jgi:flagellar biosynthesis component FlhA